MARVAGPCGSEGEQGGARERERERLCPLFGDRARHPEALLGPTGRIPRRYRRQFLLAAQHQSPPSVSCMASRASASARGRVRARGAPRPVQRGVMGPLRGADSPRTARQARFFGRALKHHCWSLTSEKGGGFDSRQLSWNQGRQVDVRASWKPNPPPRWAATPGRQAPAARPRGRRRARRKTPEDLLELNRLQFPPLLELSRAAG